MFKASIFKKHILSIMTKLIILALVIFTLLLFSPAPMYDKPSDYVQNGTDIISLREVTIKRFNGWYYSPGCLIEVNGHLATAAPDSCNQLLNETIILFDKYYPDKPREFIIYGQNIGRCSDLTTPRCPALEKTNNYIYP
ncbi:hypothetical protein [Pectobacterium odoriferum]|uniref:hypothetical protein n=1 Tax=Pectobacterium odoriferum TaxID=78398 RepID=UPI001CF5570E|nr:hypothetical protein [Pectobacterium odoriferum]MCA6960997.1 hypothetical protein [Pectobacterium odoriferum]MCH5009108.1 hypothetical protein [Pectobacterium odoriferum]